MSRIIGGVSRGRKIDVPAKGTRPTADRAREGLFSTLTTLVDLDGAVFVDLYAGSGAVGLEALSRGASSSTMVESDPRAVATIRANLAHLGLAGGAVVQQAVATYLRSAHAVVPDVVFIDPPYEQPVAADLEALVALDWLGLDSVVCVERATRDRSITWPAGMVAIKERRYGIATLWYGRRS